MNSGIYAIINKANCKIYIGRSVNLKNRLGSHFSALKNNYHINKFLQKDYNENPDLFYFEIIKLCEEKRLFNLEKYYIYHYNSENRECGYNIRYRTKVINNEDFYNHLHLYSITISSVFMKNIIPCSEIYGNLNKYFLWKWSYFRVLIGGRNNADFKVVLSKCSRFIYEIFREPDTFNLISRSPDGVFTNFISQPNRNRKSKAKEDWHNYLEMHYNLKKRFEQKKNEIKKPKGGLLNEKQ